jgi:hypothetical protein
MKEVDFAVTINLTLRLNGDKVGISVRNVDLKPAMISLPIEPVAAQVEERKTYHDIILEQAKEIVNETGKDLFTAAMLYNRARQKYPHIRRNTFNNRVMAAAPDHPSYKHLTGTKAFLKFLGEGKYKLKKGVV